MEVVKLNTTGQALRIVIRRHDYTPASLQAVIVSTSGVILQTGTLTAPWSSVSLAQDGGLGEADPDQLVVDDTTGILPGWAFLVDAGGHWAQVEIKSVDASTKTVYLADSLQVGFATGATLKPATASLSYSSAVYAAAGRWYVNLSYITDAGQVDGWKITGYTTEYPALCPIAAADLLRRWPTLHDLSFARSRESFLQEHVDGVFDKVRSQLWDAEKTIEMFIGSADTLRNHLLYEAAWDLAEMGINPLGEGDPAAFQTAIQESRARASASLDNTAAWVDLDQDGAQDSYERGMGKEYVW